MECSVVIAILPIPFTLPWFPSPKIIVSMGILILDVGGEHLLLPCHVVYASAINNPS
jgi:hypothetical protein